METWRRAKELYPKATFTMQAVQNWVRECPMCQKMRETGVRPLPAQALSLKPPSYRKVVGLDHVTVTPPDIHGNTCVLMVVEHFSHFVQAYPAKDYSAESTARILFKHFCTFGVFDAIATDPGTAFMADIIAKMNEWLGVNHKVSLVERHESNGCEGSGKQFVRHLKTLVHDKRLLDHWSDDTVLPLINFSLCSFPTTETGGWTPFQLKYGTQDAEYFRLPDNMEPGAKCHAFIKKLDENLRIVR
jgi:hypothetical protein